MSRPTIKGKNDLVTLYPELVKEWHPTKNEGIDINEISYGSNKVVWWYLPYDTQDGRHFDFEWQASVVERTSGNGCPYLCGKRVFKGFNDLQSNDEELAKQWHPTKNGDLRPDQVTICSNKLVWWLYPYDDPITGKHFDFEWQAKINNRAKKGYGCPFLSNTMVWPGYNDLNTTHPYIASCLLDKSLGSKIIYGTRNKYEFVCPDCGSIVVK